MWRMIPDDRDLSTEAYSHGDYPKICCLPHSHKILTNTIFNSYHCTLKYAQVLKQLSQCPAKNPLPQICDSVTGYVHFQKPTGILKKSKN